MNEPAGRLRSILLAVDGEPHTAGAVAWAGDLAGTTGARLVVLHVKDPYLKQFHNEIYAQGRQAYLDHVQAGLDELAVRVREDLADRLAARSLDWEFVTREGNPLEVIVAEAARQKPDLLVFGRKSAPGWRSRDLPATLARKLTGRAVLIVPG